MIKVIMIYYNRLVCWSAYIIPWQTGFITVLVSQTAFDADINFWGLWYTIKKHGQNSERLSLDLLIIPVKEFFWAIINYMTIMSNVHKLQLVMFDWMLKSQLNILALIVTCLYLFIVCWFIYLLQLSGSWV